MHIAHKHRPMGGSFVFATEFSQLSFDSSSEGRRASFEQST